MPSQTIDTSPNELVIQLIELGIAQLNASDLLKSTAWPSSKPKFNHISHPNIAMKKDEITVYVIHVFMVPLYVR